jgi:hypothetical protein
VEVAKGSENGKKAMRMLSFPSLLLDARRPKVTKYGITLPIAVTHARIAWYLHHVLTAGRNDGGTRRM